jgi:hypothetical protein
MNALRRLTRAHPVLALLAAVVLLALAACDDESTETNSTAGEIPRVTVTAKGYGFEMPDEIPAGTVTLALRNDGAEPHHAQPARLKPGVTQEQFMARLRTDPEGAVTLLSYPGGPAAVVSAGTQEVTLDLAAGDYVMLCFVPGPDGVPHLAKGMIKPFRVTGSPSDVELPRTDGEAILRDFSFTLPDDLNARQTTIKVTNAGPQVHEMAIGRLAEGKTLEDARAFLSTRVGPPPYADVGGMQAMDPGASGWLTLDLTPGRYVMFCVVPDPATGRRHVDLGMIAPFEVR